jgi:hypothetical protein
MIHALYALYTDTWLTDFAIKVLITQTSVPVRASFLSRLCLFNCCLWCKVFARVDRRDDLAEMALLSGRGRPGD